MAEKPMVPRIRFKGFADPWEQRKLGDLYQKNNERNACGFSADRTLSAATMTYNKEGNGADEGSLPNYKVVRIGDVAFEGHTNKEFAYGRFVVNTLADGIMSPRFSCLRPKHDYPVFFWKYYLHNERTMRRILVRATKRGTMMNELVPEDLFSQSVPVPSTSEQRAIGAFFSALDDLITLRQRKYDRLVQLKKALLDKMFSKPGESVPEVRFKGFADPWEQRKLGDLYRPASEKNDGSYGIDHVISVASMRFKTDVRVSGDAYLSTYNVMRIGDIAFEGNRSGGFAHGRLVENDIGDGIVSHVFKVLRPIRDHDLAYWKYAINNEVVMGPILMRTTKASTMMHELVPKDFLREAISVPPSIAEQHAIGACFLRLDELITLRQRELKMLKSVKKSLLEGMFA